MIILTRILFGIQKVALAIASFAVVLAIVFIIVMIASFCGKKSETKLFNIALVILNKGEEYIDYLIEGYGKDDTRRDQEK